MAPTDELIPVAFPERGLDVSGAYSTPGPETTADAQNVRAVDPVSDRIRGGRRPGLSKYITQRLP